MRCVCEAQILVVSSEETIKLSVNFISIKVGFVLDQ